MINKLLKKDNGYSLVELIIVIGIILVLSVGALLSYTVIHSARAKDAAVKLGSETNELKTMCMNMTPGDTTHDYYALAVYNDADGTTHLCRVMHIVGSSNDYDYIDEEDVNLTTSVDVKFDGSSLNKGDSANALASDTGGLINPGIKTNPLYICFDKRGNCYSGYGDYYFYKNNGNQVARVHLSQNGSIDVR
jgi:prepilin-type N-terminal cleavage/methylation domain-containing protein